LEIGGDMKFLITVLIVLMFSSLAQSEGMGEKAVDKAFNNPKFQKKKNEKKLEKIPLKLSFGFALSKYRLFDVYDTPAGEKDRVPSIFGSEINISAIVDRSTVKKYQHKIPKKFRKLALSFGEIGATHLYIPKTLYIQPRNSSGIEAYGATWGLVPQVSWGPLVVGGGVIATYIHYRDFNHPDPVNFIRPGLRGKIGLRLPLFNRYLTLEVGGKGDVYVPQKFYGNNSLWNVRGIYAQVHFRVPYTAEAKI